MAVDPGRYRAIMGSYPAGVVVITAIDAAGEPRGLTSTALCSVSIDPPLLLVCVDKTSNTLPGLRHSRAFVANLLAAGSEHISQRFASKLERKFEGLQWRPSPVADGAPIVDDHCAAYAECRCVQEIEAGDHVILIARVDGGEVASDGTPLVFRSGVYRAWPFDVPAATAAAPSKDVRLPPTARERR